MTTQFLLGEGEDLETALLRFENFKSKQAETRSEDAHWAWQIDPKASSVEIGFDVLADSYVVDSARKLFIDGPLWINPTTVEEDIKDNSFYCLPGAEFGGEDPLVFDDQGHTLSDEQRAAVLRIIDSPSRIIRLTGKAGTGKSAILKWFKRKTNATVLATTGRAALNIGGRTVDSFFAFRRPDRDNKRTKKRGHLEDAEVAKYKDYFIITPWRTAESIYTCGEFIFVDESSMVGAGMMWVLYVICTLYKKKLILVGDWAQIAPVEDEWIIKNKKFMENHETIRLLECHRQSDVRYLAALDAVRTGFARGDEDMDLYEEVFRSRVGPPPEHDLGVRLFAYRKSVNAYNSLCLDRLIHDTGGVLLQIKPAFFDFRTERQRRKVPFNYYDIQGMERDSLMAAVAVDGAQLAIGAHVLITKNARSGRTFTNGQTGVLIGARFKTEDEEAQDQYAAAKAAMLAAALKEAELDDDMAEATRQDAMIEDPRLINTMLARGAVISSLVVREDETDAILNVTRIPIGEERTRRRNDAITLAEQYHYCLLGFPIILGYAMTIHKAQGLSVNHCYVDMESIENFPRGHGMAYVALSRTRTLDGLILSKFLKQAVRIDHEMRGFI